MHFPDRLSRPKVSIRSGPRQVHSGGGGSRLGFALSGAGLPLRSPIAAPSRPGRKRVSAPMPSGGVFRRAAMMALAAMQRMKMPIWTFQRHLGVPFSILGAPTEAEIAVAKSSAQRFVFDWRNVRDGRVEDGRGSLGYPNHLSNVPCPLPRRIERVRVSIASPLTRPSPYGRRVGIRIVTFEACSGFTHVTARRIAQPPKATFVTRLQPFRFPGRAARQLPDQSTTLWVESSSTDDSRLRGALPTADISRGIIRAISEVLKTEFLRSYTAFFEIPRW